MSANGSVALPITKEQAAAVQNLAQIATPIFAQLMAVEYAHAMRAALDKAGISGGEEQTKVDLTINISRPLDISLKAAETMNAALSQILRNSVAGNKPKLAGV